MRSCLYNHSKIVVICTAELIDLGSYCLYQSDSTVVLATNGG